MYLHWCMCNVHEQSSFTDYVAVVQPAWLKSSILHRTRVMMAFCLHMLCANADIHWAARLHASAFFGVA
jgi:hypothetical protein